MWCEAITSFFQIPPQTDGRSGWKYYIEERKGAYSIVDTLSTTNKSIELWFNEDNEMRVTLYDKENPIVTVQRIAVQKVDLIIEDDEISIQFVLDRMPSRMIRLQMKPFLAIEMGLYWETCDECD
ncbi:hypothetical protein BAMA_19590 [Bacillus manliponensis]|uniref:DUF3979 domain-containing protein n=1 Tax=Bacillus manliponensis TaxID=574376 RepID=A0A073KCH3_9BACI|nr:DUF3979 family protein [Bacillus manliponensis]KEK19968.1 hypothetical protein BAMA_19590 [Bacillus manliponensis]